MIDPKNGSTKFLIIMIKYYSIIYVKIENIVQHSVIYIYIYMVYSSDRHPTLGRDRVWLLGSEFGLEANL